MNLRVSAKLLSLAISFCAFLFVAGPPAQAQPFASKTLFSFSGATGQYPYDAGYLLMDASGNLYGTTYQGGANGYGTVFELVNSSGTYTEKVLYSFTNSNGDGANPQAGVIMDASGNLYGTTLYGGANFQGTVFELVNSAGTYTEKVLYSFTSSNGDGANPYAGVIMDASGNLYGTTLYGGANGYGTVFELVNSSGTYTEKVLYTFTNSYGDGASPYAGVIMDASGNLYGTTYIGGTSGHGTVFEMVNSAGTYSEKVLYRFTNSGGDGANSQAGVIMDASGNLYGTTWQGGTSGYGTVFELVNSSGNYSEKVLYSFQNSPDGATPLAGLIMDAFGNLYGTTYQGGTSGYGTVFEVVNTNGTTYPTTTTVTSSTNPAVAGTAITLTATVTSSSGFPPTGTVTFSSATLSPITANVYGNGTAQIYLTAAEALGGIGTYAVTAQYTPRDPALAPSSGTFNQTINEAGVVVTNGNNTLTGTETVNGSVDATLFAGNGAGLTGVTALGLNCAGCIGNMQLGINYAGSTSQGGAASNSLLLNGFPSSAFQPAGPYATTGANLFSGNQSITGNLSVTGNSAATGTTTIGPGGTPIVQHLSTTVNPSFKPLSYGCTSQSFTFTGVNDGDTVALGVPNERMTATDVIYTAWVSAANTVTIRACAFTAKPKNFGSGAIRVDVWQH